jgi:ribosome-binding protein aMBF1 (putative translation factor)
MPLTPEQRDPAFVSELKRIGSLMNLSDDQKRKLHDFMSEASEKVQEYRQQHPDASQQDLAKKIADNRTVIRQRLAGFLTPEQLNIWDTQVAKAKEFLGQKLAA